MAESRKICFYNFVNTILYHFVKLQHCWAGEARPGWWGPCAPTHGHVCGWHIQSWKKCTKLSCSQHKLQNIFTCIRGCKTTGGPVINQGSAHPAIFGCLARGASWPERACAATANKNVTILLALTLGAGTCWKQTLDLEMGRKNQASPWLQPPFSWGKDSLFQQPLTKTTNKLCI